MLILHQQSDTSQTFILKAKTPHTRHLFLLAALSFAAAGSFAQSVTENTPKQLPVKRDSVTLAPHSTEPQTTPVASREHSAAVTCDTDFRLADSIASHDSKNLPPLENKSHTGNQLWNNVFGINNLGVYSASSEDLYPHLLDRRNAAFSLGFRSNGFYISAGLVANRYETRTVTTQFGVNGLLEYRFSPHWSMAVFGALYNRNPYFSMATYPFVETSEYGGWVRYEGDRFGIKLGTRRYYDSFQRRWHMEPIVTPSVKLGKKFVLELPVGPLVQKSMEKLLRKDRRDGSIIMPDFE